MQRTAAVVAAAALVLGAGNAPAQALLDAVRARNEQEVSRLLAARVDVNEADALGTTPLQWAARYGDAALVERLIEAGASPKAENVFGVTPMSEAALIGSEPVIRELLAAGVDADSPNPEGETALMLVVRTGQLDAAELLIEAGADVNAKERWAGQTALMWAGAQLQPAMVKLLLAHGAEVNARSAVRDSVFLARRTILKLFMHVANREDDPAAARDVLQQQKVKLAADGKLREIVRGEGWQFAVVLAVWSHDILRSRT